MGSNIVRLREEVAVPGVRSAALPRAASNRAQLFGGRVEDGGLVRRRIAELAARDRVHAVILTQEDAIRIEDGHAELALERAQRSEHPIDRASRLLASLVGRDDQKTPLAQVASAANRNSVRGPVVEERVDRREQRRLVFLLERGRDSEDPDVGLVAELIDVHTHYADQRKLAP